MDDIILIKIWTVLTLKSISVNYIILSFRFLCKCFHFGHFNLVVSTIRCIYLYLLNTCRIKQNARASQSPSNMNLCTIIRVKLCYKYFLTTAVKLKLNFRKNWKIIKILCNVAFYNSTASVRSILSLVQVIMYIIKFVFNLYQLQWKKLYLLTWLACFRDTEIRVSNVKSENKVV